MRAFWPAYYEDHDMAYRLKLAGIPCGEIPGLSEHFGSATIRKDPRFSNAEFTDFLD